MVHLKVIVLLSVFLAIFAQISAVALPGTNPARCGNEDGDLVRNKRWAHMHHGHKNKTITYRIKDYSKNHTQADIDDVIKRAFSKWSEHTDLTFVQKQPDESVDVNIRFVVREHNCVGAFDGEGGVLAHATLEFVHFDDEEHWKVKNSDEGTSLYKVAIHEIGHSLGLAHSKEESAIMFWAHTNDDEDQFKLDDDDIKGVQEIYGEKKVLSAYSEDLCKDPTFDTMFETPEGKIYIFKKDKYYELSQTVITVGPKPISEKWKGLPASITAAFSQNGKTFFFKDGQFWRFTGYELDQGYPERVNRYYSEIPDNFKTATVWEDGKVYFFRGSKFYRMDGFNEQYTNVTEKFIKDDFNGIPSHPDVVHYSKSFGFTLFFKLDKFYAYETARNAPNPYSISTTSYFFGCRSRSHQ